MPIIEVNLLEGRTAEQKAALAAALTDAAVSSIGAAPESVRIIIREMANTEYAVAGETVAAKKAREAGI